MNAVRLRALLAGLAAFPHRGSTTAQEADAAAWLQRDLEAKGHRVVVEWFSSPKTYSWEVIGAAGLMAGGLLAAFASPIVGLVLAVVGASWFYTQFSGLPHPFDALSPRGRSQNLVVRAGEGARQVVFMAHLDSAKTAFVYAPARVRQFRRTFVISATMAALSAPVVALQLALPAARWLGLPIAAYFVANAALFVWRELRAPFVNGANDNATGVAAAVTAFEALAALALPGKVTLLLTGCEEVGARGAKAFHAAHPEETEGDALVVNLDNVGRGVTHLATGEGMLRYFSYRPKGVAAARVAARSLGLALPEVEYRLAYFDALPFAQDGVPVVTLIALDDGIIPNWHWPTDVLLNVDPAVADSAALLALETARAFLLPGAPPSPEVSAAATLAGA